MELTNSSLCHTVTYTIAVSLGIREEEVLTGLWPHDGSNLLVDLSLPSAFHASSMSDTWGQGGVFNCQGLSSKIALGSSDLPFLRWLFVHVCLQIPPVQVAIARCFHQGSQSALPLPPLQMKSDDILLR